MVSLEENLSGILAVRIQQLKYFFFFAVGKPGLSFTYLPFPPSSLSDGLSRHSAYNMEVSPDFGGPAVLPGPGSVCLQSERAAHRPDFWVLVRPEQNYKVHHPFLQSFRDCR